MDKKLIAGAFTAGLLHDIGKLILGTTSPGFYRTLNALKLEDPTQYLVRERNEFGSTHADIGAYLLGSWGLPQDIINAVLTHHSFESLKSIDFSTSLAVWFANAFVDGDADHFTINGFNLTNDMLQNKVLAAHVDSWTAACIQILTR